MDELPLSWIGGEEFMMPMIISRCYTESRMPAVLFEAGMLVNRAEEQVLSSPARRATVAKAVAEAVERFCAVRIPPT